MFTFVNICCRCSVSSSEVICRKVFVSSAFKAALESSGMMFGRSLINNTNNIGLLLTKLGPFQNISKGGSSTIQNDVDDLINQSIQGIADRI